MLLGTAYDVANLVCAVLFPVCILVLLPLSIPLKTRGWAATGLLWSSLAFGAMLWLYSIIYVYAVWGIIGVLVGLALFGLGIVPVAVLAAVIHSEWSSSMN